MSVQSNQSTLNRAEAERLTERIRVALDRVSTAWADLGERITEAYQRRADLALGYDSWSDYAEAELKPSEGLAAEVRRQLVGMLSQAGMSTRAIAPTVGIGQTQVRNDLSTKCSPEHDSQAGVSDGRTSPERIDHATGEVLTNYNTGEIIAPATPRDTTGLDGKTYPRPEPQQQPAQKRRPLPDAARDIGWELRRASEKLDRIMQDDRFTTHKNEVATHLRGHLIDVIEVCQKALDQLPEGK